MLLKQAIIASGAGQASHVTIIAWVGDDELTRLCLWSVGQLTATNTYTKTDTKTDTYKWKCKYNELGNEQVLVMKSLPGTPGGWDASEFSVLGPDGDDYDHRNIVKIWQDVIFKCHTISSDKGRMCVGQPSSLTLHCPQVRNLMKTSTRSQPTVTQIPILSAQ